MAKTLTMTLPTEFVGALNRQFNGRELTVERAAQLQERMDFFYVQYNAAKKRIDKLDRFWEDKNVEGHYKEPIWYNAHTRLKKAEKELCAAHRSMFYILLEADGNLGYGTFTQFGTWAAQDIYEDFYKKYVKKHASLK